MKNRMLLFDTDIGTDVDDALALTFLSIVAKEFLWSVSVTNGPVTVRANAARTILDALQISDIPVFRGISKPLTKDTTNFTSGKEKVGISIHHHILSTHQLLNKIKISHRNSPIRIISTAPLTTIAHIVDNSRVRTRIAEIFLMGGSSGTNGLPLKEHNFTADPKAANLVLSSHIPIFIVPLDLTIKYPLTKNEINRFRCSTTRTGKLLWRWMCNWLETTNHLSNNDKLFKNIIYLHDPITCMAAIHPQLFHWKKIHCNISNDGVMQLFGPNQVNLCTSTPSDIKNIILSVLNTCL